MQVGDDDEPTLDDVRDALRRLGTERAYRFVLHPGELAKVAAKRLAPFVLGPEAVQERVRTTLRRSASAHRGSPLSEDRGGRAGIHAVDRAPDALVVDAKRWRRGSLFDRLDGPGEMGRARSLHLA